MSEPVTTIVAALIGAVLGSGGAVLIQYLLTSRSEKLRRREILVQRYLFQLQDALEMLWYRLDNLANQYGRSVMSEEYFEKTTLYVLGRVLAIERIFMLEAVYPQLDAIYRGLGKCLKQNRFDLKLQAYLKSQTFDFYQYDRFLLAEAVIVHEGDIFRTSTYLESKRGYEEKEALEKEWLERAKKVILSFDEDQNNERVKGLLDTLIAIAKYIENKTGIDSSLTVKPGGMLNCSMATIHKSIDIDAPAERAFEMLTDPKRLPEYAPGLISVENIRQTEQHIGDSFRATYSVLGLHFPMTFTATEYEQPTKLTTRFEGGMKGTWTWLLEPRGNSTYVTTAMEYEMAGGALGKAMNAVLVERMNEKNAERLLENLKLVSEATP